MNDAERTTSFGKDFSARGNFAGSFSSEREKSPIKSEKFIVFFLGESLYAVSSKQVAEIVRPLSLTSLPNVPEWILGIANLRGEIISVIDLQKFISEKAADASPKSKFIILRPKDSIACIAFSVGRLSEIVTLSAEEIEPAGDESPPYIFGKVARKSTVLRLIDAKNLFSALAARPLI